MQFNSMLTTAAPFILALMMLGMGLSLKIQDFARLIYHPKPVLLGSLLQIIGLPVIGYVIVLSLGLSKEIAVGMMILASCPGGPGSNLLAYICRADTALSVTLTGISSILAVITIPVVVNFALNEFMLENHVNISVATSVIAISLITLLPLSIGIIISHLRPGFSERVQGKVKLSSIIFLLLLVFSTFYKARHNLIELFIQAGLPALLLCLATISLGFLAAKLFRMNSAIQKTISIEVGIQNGALAIVVASSLLNSNLMAIPAAMYSPIMISASVAFMLHVFYTKETVTKNTINPLQTGKPSL